MRVSDVVRVDSKGRVMIPMALRQTVGLVEGMYVMLIADLDRKSVSILPFADPRAKLIEFRIGIGDVPGALARVAKVLADAKVDLLSTESRTLRRGRRAEWTVVADTSECVCSLAELKKRVLEEGAAAEVQAREFQR